MIHLKSPFKPSFNISHLVSVILIRRIFIVANVDGLAPFKSAPASSILIGSCKHFRALFIKNASTYFPAVSR